MDNTEMYSQTITKMNTILKEFNSSFRDEENEHYLLVTKNGEGVQVPISKRAAKTSSTIMELIETFDIELGGEVPLSVEDANLLTTAVQFMEVHWDDDRLLQKIIDEKKAEGWYYIRDEDGNIVKDENGNPKKQWRYHRNGSYHPFERYDHLIDYVNTVKDFDDDPEDYNDEYGQRDIVKYRAKYERYDEYSNAVKEFDKVFLKDCSFELLYQLMALANFLNTKPFYEFTTKTVALRLKGKSVYEIRKMLGITDEKLVYMEKLKQTQMTEEERVEFDEMTEEEKYKYVGVTEEALEEFRARDKASIDKEQAVVKKYLASSNSK